MPTRLFIVSTPIGNLGDITWRAKEVLTEVQVILAEDTRVSAKLMHHLGLHKRLISCHDHNEHERAKLLEGLVAEGGDIALISDAGTPLLSDPGFGIVGRAIALGIQVVPVPGPSAALAALVVSGLDASRFTFEGFLPDRAGPCQKRLDSLRQEERTMIFYVAPHDASQTVDRLAQTFGPDRLACLAREITKFYEEFIRGSLSEILSAIADRHLKGECVLVVGGAQGTKGPVSSEVVGQRLAELLQEGARLRDAAKLLAPETGWSASEIYKLGLERRGESP